MTHDSDLRSLPSAADIHSGHSAYCCLHQNAPSFVPAWLIPRSCDSLTYTTFGLGAAERRVLQICGMAFNRISRPTDTRTKHKLSQKHDVKGQYGVKPRHVKVKVHQGGKAKDNRAEQKAIRKASSGMSHTGPRRCVLSVYSLQHFRH